MAPPARRYGGLIGQRASLSQREDHCEANEGESISAVWIMGPVAVLPPGIDPGLEAISEVPGRTLLEDR